MTVESADDAAAAAKEHGGTVAMEAFDVMDVGRMAVVQDPTGAFFAVWEPRESIGAERVNEPGSLTINQLNTSDPERAQEFYSAVFGWRFRAGPGRRHAVLGHLQRRPAQRGHDAAAARRRARRRTGSSTSAARAWTTTPAASASSAGR